MWPSDKRVWRHLLYSNISLKPSTFHQQKRRNRKITTADLQLGFSEIIRVRICHSVVVADWVTWTKYRRSPVSAMSVLLVSANLQAYIGKWKELIDQGSATYGPQAGSGPTNKIIRPVALFANCSDCMARLVVLYFMNLTLKLLVLHAYEELQYLWESALCYKCTLYRIWCFHYKLWKSGLAWLKFHKFPSFNNITNSGGNCWLKTSTDRHGLK